MITLKLINRPKRAMEHVEIFCLNPCHIDRTVEFEVIGTVGALFHDQVTTFDFNVSGVVFCVEADFWII